MISSSSILFLCFFLISKSVSYEIQTFGDFVTKDDYKNRNFCSTKFCISENDRLIKEMTQNETVRPCDDFKTFAMGEFLATRVINERYPLLGFEVEVLKKHNEKMKNVLKQPITDDDSRMFKVVKSFYQKFVDSDSLKLNGAKDIINFLNEAGGSPLTDASWNESSYKPLSLFYNPTLSATELFFDHELSRCKDPRDSSNEVLCMKHKADFSYTDILKDDILQVLKSLNLKETFKSEMLDDYLEFLMSKQKLEKEFFESERKIVRIKDLPQMFPDLTLDWVEVFNKLLLRESQVTGEDEIGIEGPVLIAKMSELFVKLDKRTIANAAAISFLYGNKEFFITHHFDKQSAENLRAKKSVQRFERCILHLNFRLAPALEALAARTYFNKTLQAAAEEMVKELFEDMIHKIETKIQIDDEKVKTNLISNLKKTKFSVMFSEELLNGPSIVEKLYEGFEVDFSKPLLQMYMNITLFHKQLMNDKKSNWKKRLNTLSEIYKVEMWKEENMLVIPRGHAFYPSFHPERPRFSNMATFYMNVAGPIYSLIEDFLSRKTDQVVNLTEIQPFVLMDENYLRWEAAGGKELELSAFRLTNRQMMWLALANRLTVKVHRNFPIFNNNLKKILNLHELFMSFKEFRSAYHCNEN